MGELRDKFLAELQGMQQSGRTSPHVDITTAIASLEETALAMGVLRDMLSAELQDTQQSGSAPPHTDRETTSARPGVEQGGRGSDALYKDTGEKLKASAAGKPTTRTCGPGPALLPHATTCVTCSLLVCTLRYLHQVCLCELTLCTRLTCTVLAKPQRLTYDAC